MEKLRVNHMYIAKNLPFKQIKGLFGSERLDDRKTLQKVIVLEVTEKCYKLALEDSSNSYYVEKDDTDIVYIEDLGVIAKTTNK
jgi:hypothetical protein